MQIGEDKISRLVRFVAPHRWWHWPLGIAFWGAIASVVVYVVEWFWKPSAMGPPVEHYIVTTIMATPLVLPALFLIRHLDRLHREVAKLAATDSLTGLMNRRAFLAAASQAGGGGLLMMDLDHFKAVNDSHGHAVGDDVLIEMAQVLKRTVRDGDLLGRLGGEEFAVYVQCDRASTAMTIGERLAQGVVYSYGELQLQVTASVGVVMVPPGTHVHAALHLADQALYRAKSAGRARAVMVQGPTDMTPATATG